MMVESKQAHLQLLVFTFFLLYWHPTLIRAKESEHEFDYKEGSEKGPEHWGELKKEWEHCKDGKLQSPIGLSDDHVTKVTPSLEDLKMSYKPSNATVKNEGHYLAIEWEGDAGSIKINGTDYFFKQCHWHTPSEHSINGIRYDLELHMVHQSTNPKIKNSIAVIAFLYQIGNPNPFLSKVNNDIMSEVATKEVHIGVIDPREIKWTSFSFYRYIGSLTSPPCTEGVIWTINERVKHVSREQVELLQEAVHDYAMTNARPLQPLNGRDIKLLPHRFHRSASETCVLGVEQNPAISLVSIVVASGGCILRKSFDYLQASKARTMEVLNTSWVPLIDWHYTVHCTNL